MSERVCRPKLLKNLCLSLVSGVPRFFFRTTPLVLSRGRRFVVGRRARPGMELVAAAAVAAAGDIVPVA